MWHQLGSKRRNICCLKEGKQGQANNNINDNNNDDGDYDDGDDARKVFIQHKHQILLAGMQRKAERSFAEKET